MRRGSTAVKITAGMTFIGLLLLWPTAALGQAPDTTIDSAPPAFTNSPNATFAFSGTNATSFECKLDSGSFSPCTSPRNLTSLSEGQHTFQVRGVSGAGAPDPTPASHTWTADFTAPDTNLTAAPPTLTNQTSATFEFSTPDGSASLECSLNGAAYSACTSPVSYIGLSDATRTFSVRAVDPAANVDVTPPTHTWTVDTVSPDTTIAGGPPDPTNQKAATFDLSSTEPGGTFQCAVDGGAFAVCPSPFTTPNLPDGSHTLHVRAADGAGNVDASPASRTWQVDTAPPAKPSASIAPITVRGRGRRPPSLRAAGGRAPVSAVTARFQTQRTLKLKWSAPTAVKYDVTYQKIPPGTNFDPDQDYATGTTAKSASFTASVGFTYCFVVAAFDAAGNKSPVRNVCTTLPHHAKDMFRAGCTVKSGPGHYLAKFTQGCALIRMRVGPGDIASQTLPQNGQVKRVVLVATRCPSCGKVRVVVSGLPGVNVPSQTDFSGVVDLTRSSTQKRKVITVKTFSNTSSSERRFILVQRLSGTPQIEGIGVTQR